MTISRCLKNSDVLLRPTRDKLIANATYGRKKNTSSINEIKAFITQLRRMLLSKIYKQKGVIETFVQDDMNDVKQQYADVQKSSFEIYIDDDKETAIG